MLSPETRARLDPYLRRVGLYYAYTLRGEHIYTARRHLQDVIDTLQNGGYEPPPRVAGIPLEAAKRHRDDADHYHDASLRKVDSDDPRRQFHVHLFDTAEGVEIHAHLEYRPDFGRIGEETHRDRVRRLREHFRPVHGERWHAETDDGPVTYVRGRHDKTVYDLV